MYKISSRCAGNIYTYRNIKLDEFIYTIMTSRRDTMRSGSRRAYTHHTQSRRGTCHERLRRIIHMGL